MAIDWSKPIRAAGSKLPATLLHTYNARRGPSRFVAWQGEDGEEHCAAFPNDTDLFENVPERREWWANVYRLGNSVDTSNARFASRGEAEQKAASGCLGQVLLHVDNDDNPPLQLEVGKTYRTRGGAIVRIDRYDPHYAVGGVQFPFIDESGFSYRGDGAYTPDRAPHSFDIIAELP